MNKGLSLQEAVQIITKLAEVDPVYKNYQGETYCFFCGAFEEDGDTGLILHKEDCLWKQAKRIEE